MQEDWPKSQKKKRNFHKKLQRWNDDLERPIVSKCIFLNIFIILLNVN